MAVTTSDLEENGQVDIVIAVHADPRPSTVLLAFCAAQFLGTLPLTALGQRVASLQPQRQVVVDALDFLFQGF